MGCKMNFTKQHAIEFYLEWFENFLTLQYMSMHYGVEFSRLVGLLEIGGELRKGTK